MAKSKDSEKLDLILNALYKQHENGEKIAVLNIVLERLSKLEEFVIQHPTYCFYLRDKWKRRATNISTLMFILGITTLVTHLLGLW